MRNTFAEKQFGFSLFEFAVSMVILLVLTAVMLSRVAIYQAEAEQVEVEQLIGTLRVALRMRAENPMEKPSRAELRQLADNNPFDLLERKPANYFGEYYSAETEKIPAGNWVFDRRDKCLIYLAKSNKSSPSNRSKFLKFKVEFQHVQMTRGKNEATGDLGGLTIEQIDDRSSACSV